MAEGFANHYGDDVLVATSAGLSPVDRVALPTVATMREKNIDISRHVPQLYDPRLADRYDLIINMSGSRLPGVPPKEFQDWSVRDPYRNTPAVYRAVRDDLEQRVMRMILLMRRNSR